jgi:hypothetical protein
MPRSAVSTYFVALSIDRKGPFTPSRCEILTLGRSYATPRSYTGLRFGLLLPRLVVGADDVGH